MDVMGGWVNHLGLEWQASDLSSWRIFVGWFRDSVAGMWPIISTVTKSWIVSSDLP